MRQPSSCWILGILLVLLFEIGSIEGFAQVRTKNASFKGTGFGFDNPSQGISRYSDTKLFCVDSVTQRNGRKQIDKNDARANFRFQKRHESQLFSSLTFSEPFTSVGSRHTRTNLITVALCFAIACTSSKMIASAAGTAFTKMQQGLVWYSAMLDLFPIATKSISAGVIGALGDFMAQRMEHGVLFSSKRKDTNSSLSTVVHHQLAFLRRILNWLSIGGRYDGRRGLSIAFDGLFVSGPLMHIGYDLFESVLPVSGGGTVAALAHVIADTLLLDSIFVATTIWVTGLFEGYSFKELFPQFRRDYVPALKAGGITSFLVLPLELVCFRFLPVSFRVLAVNFIDIIWDAVISHFAHRSRHHEDPSTQSEHFSPEDSPEQSNQTTSVEVKVLFPPQVILRKDLETPLVGLEPSPSSENYLLPTVA